MKYLITESQLDRIIFKYLDNQDFIQIEKNNRIYFITLTEPKYKNCLYLLIGVFFNNFIVRTVRFYYCCTVEHRDLYRHLISEICTILYNSSTLTKKYEVAETKKTNALFGKNY